MDAFKERIKWIDCAKFISICGVLVDHTFNVVHNSFPLWRAAFFSVSVFVLLSGISSRLTCSNSGQQGKVTKRLLKFGGQYALATALVLIWRAKVWNLKLWLSCLLEFNAEAHFYFLVFFFQLVLISPFLLKWCCYCGKQKNRWLYHICTLVILGIVSSICIRYTYILPVHGGGQYLFGGTYLLLYYLGMVLEDVSSFARRESKSILLLLTAGGGVMWFVWWRLLISGCLPFDRWLEKWWGDGANPPSVNCIVFSIITLACMYALFSLLEQYCKHLIEIVAFLGKYTIYTFMYHMLVLAVIRDKFPAVTSAGSLVKWIAIFLPMLILPVIVAVIFGKISIRVKKAYLVDADEKPLSDNERDVKCKDGK